MTLAKQREAKRVIPLKVSAAFHSPLMHEAAAGLADAIAAIPEIAAPIYPVLSNISATPLCEPDALRHELIEQMTSPVRWSAVVERMAAEGAQCFVEIGPGSVLTGLIKRITSGVELINVADAEAVERWVTLAHHV